MNKLFILLLLIPMVSLSEDITKDPLHVYKPMDIHQFRIAYPVYYYIDDETLSIKIYEKHYSKKMTFKKFMKIFNPSGKTSQIIYPEKEYVSVPSNNPPALLPPPCSIGLEGMPCVKGM